ncbi:hypothetical protein VE02_05466 [Pseudogymnoascus sp. 03VT05]|nr:hypothetical protein VE02_05466 [Pseudogymnoascus sp. 03VT05]
MPLTDDQLWTLKVIERVASGFSLLGFHRRMYSGQPPWLLMSSLFIVFHRYDAESLRNLEWKYFSFITTLVSIPAIGFLFVNTQEKGPMYGSVTLWCAINPNWVLFRLIFYYGPIWFLILIAMVLYGLIGVNILKRKQAFKAISNDSFPLETVSHNDGDSDDANGQDGESASAQSIIIII